MSSLRTRKIKQCYNFGAKEKHESVSVKMAERKAKKSRRRKKNIKRSLGKDQNTNNYCIGRYNKYLLLMDHQERASAITIMCDIHVFVDQRCSNRFIIIDPKERNLVGTP